MMITMNDDAIEAQRFEGREWTGSARTGNPGIGELAPTPALEAADLSLLGLYTQMRTGCIAV